MFVPSKLIQPSGSNPMVANKLDGFTSFRATAVLKIQVNSQPFQQGRLIFSAIPMPALISPRDDYMLKHPTYIQAINHIQLDISKQTEVSLRVPFVSPFNSFNLIDNKFAWARVTAMVYSPLIDQSAGTKVAHVPLRVWGHFEDIELGTPTSGLLGNVDAGMAIQQSGRLREPNPKSVKVAQKSESLGLVDSLGAGVQSVYKTVGDTVPFLKPVTDVFSSMSKAGTGIVGKLLGFLGFCKPQHSVTGNSVLLRPTEYFGNANGADHSHVLALDFMNNVDYYPGLGGTNCDEMSFDFLKKIPQFVDWFDYTDDPDQMDKILFETWVSPTYFAPGELQIQGVNNASIPAANQYYIMNELQPTVLNYISSAFMYWTGSLVYTFRFVKTDYHSGRVEISFHPMTNTTPAERKNYVYRLVVDLRENTEVSVSVPYISPTAWKQVMAKDPLAAGKWEEYGPCATGKLLVRSITPLIHNAIVAPKVECLVEVRAGDDFQVQGACRSGYFPFVPYTADHPNLVDGLNRKRSIEEDENAIYPIQQSGPFALAGTSETRTAAIEGLIPESITRGSADIHRSDTSMVCSGEKFSNLREISKRFCFAEKVPGKIKVDNKDTPYFDTTKHVISRNPAYYLRAPHLRSIAFAAMGANNVQYGFDQFRLNNNITPLCWISSLFAFYRGGMRYKLYVPPDKASNPYPATNICSARLVDKNDLPKINSWDQVTSAVVGRRSMSYMAPAAYELIRQKGFAEFQTPFYSPVLLNSAWDELRVTQFDQSSQQVDFAFSPERTNIDVLIATAASDDLTFHVFLGVPPVFSIGRVNAGYTAPAGSGITDYASYIDVTKMNVDPAYPLSTLSTQNSKWQEVQPGTSYGVKITDLVPNIVRQNSKQYKQVRAMMLS
nr:MAG: structural polyprotein [Dicistroviridae sp.]